MAINLIYLIIEPFLFDYMHASLDSQFRVRLHVILCVIILALYRSGPSRVTRGELFCNFFFFLLGAWRAVEWCTWCWLFYFIKMDFDFV